MVKKTFQEHTLKLKAFMKSLKNSYIKGSKGNASVELRH